MERVLWIWFYHIRVIFAKYFSIILINLRFAKRVNMPDITVQWKYWLRIREPGKIPIGGSTSVIYTSGKLFHSTPPPPSKKKIMVRDPSNYCSYLPCSINKILFTNTGTLRYLYFLLWKKLFSPKNVKRCLFFFMREK